MAILYNQASTHRLGTALIDFISSGHWNSLDVAVAWVRRSGTRHLLPALRGFVQSGGRVRFGVGIDIENTSVEGLSDLLSLEQLGDCRTTICHNEASPTFHPKLYLLRADNDARLIVGSNNITEPGLFTNTEASLQIDLGSNDDLVLDALAAIDSWADVENGLARILDNALLQELQNEGYIFSDRELSRRRISSRTTTRGTTSGRRRTRLFQSKVVPAPAPPEGRATGRAEDEEPSSRTARPTVSGTLSTRGNDPVTITNVLIMRVRPARGTQIQIPIPLRNCAFFTGEDAVTSSHDDQRRAISATHPERAGGQVNTYKLEIPETRGMAVPVIRLERSVDGIRYYAYDGDSPQGKAILESLRDGINATPTQTVLTKPSDPDHSTWYRFI